LALAIKVCSETSPSPFDKLRVTGWFLRDPFARAQSSSQGDWLVSSRSFRARAIRFSG
jgi:hypothetical protein